MQWKEQLSEIEKTFGSHEERDWKPAVDLVRALMEQYPDDVEVNVRAIYILHNILVEERHPNLEEDYMTALLQKYFHESYQRFSENAEYLYFVSAILHIAEWFFGLQDDDKPMEKRLRYQMEKRAFEKEPDNMLYELEHRFSLDNNNKTADTKKRIGELSKKLLFENTDKIEWLKSKGFPGKYLLRSVQYSYNEYCSDAP